MLEDGSSPISDMLDQMKAGLWLEDPDLQHEPDDAQISAHGKLASWFMLMANEGVPAYKEAVKHLDDGIWEFRLGARRVSFFDTPGDGTYVAKHPHKTRDASEYPEDDMWWFPGMDYFIRLGHYWPKNTQKTPVADLDECARIRSEDLKYDES